MGGLLADGWVTQKKGTVDVAQGLLVCEIASSVNTCMQCTYDRCYEAGRNKRNILFFIEIGIAQCHTTSKW